MTQVIRMRIAAVALAAMLLLTLAATLALTPTTAQGLLANTPTPFMEPTPLPVNYDLMNGCIAFIADVDPQQYDPRDVIGGLRILLISPLGQTPRQVPTGLNSRHSDVAWSPDGRWLAFVANERPDSTGDSEVFIIQPDGANLWQVSRDAGENFRPVWSSDSRSLAYIETTGSGSFVHVVHAFGDNDFFMPSDPITIASASGGNSLITHLSAVAGAKTADAELLSYTERVGGDAFIRLLRWDGTPPDVDYRFPILAATGPYYLGIDWANGGEEYALTQYSGQYRIFFNTVNGEVPALSSPAQSAHSPTISPHLTHYAFISSRDGFANLWLYDGVSASARLLFAADMDMSSPSWRIPTIDDVPVDCGE